MASNSVGVVYHKLHHFLTDAPWSAVFLLAVKINDRRLEVMNQSSQTRINKGFSLIIDDSVQGVKVAILQRGLRRQYIGEVGKTDGQGIVVVTTHLYDGVRNIPLDIESYQHASSLAEGKEDPEFLTKPELARLISRLNFKTRISTRSGVGC